MPTNAVGVNFTYKNEGKIFGIKHDPISDNNLHNKDYGHFDITKFKEFFIFTIIDRNFKSQNVSLTKLKELMKIIKANLLELKLYNVYFNELNILKFNILKFLKIVEETFFESFWSISCAINNSHNCDINNDCMPFIEIKYNNLNTTALLDSGADCNLISYKFIENLNLNIRNVDNNIDVLGVSGSVDIIGVVDLVLNTGDISLTNDEFFVVKGELLSSPILLGSPFLIKNEFNINFKDKSIQIRNKDINWIDPNSSILVDDSEFNLKLAQDLIIKPRSSICINFQLPAFHKLINCCQLTDVNEILIDKNLVILDHEIETLLPIVNNHINLEVRNYSNNTVSLPKNSPFATVQLIKEIPSICVPSSNNVFCVNNINSDSDELSEQVEQLIGSSSKSFRDVIVKNIDVFAKNDSDIGKINNYFHRIDLIDDIPVNCKPYRTPHSKMKIIDDEIDRLLKCGIIQKSQSPYSAPCILVYKKSGKPRLVIDFRQVNKKIVPIRYPLPHLETSLQLLGGNSLFTTLDLISGYHQVPLRPEDYHKTAFSTGRGLFEFTRTPFGMITSGAAMQIAIERVLSGLINKACLVYVDDIIIMGKDELEHDRNLDLVLSRLKDNGFKLNFQKCEFKKSKIECLGHIVSDQGISPHPSRINVLVNKKPPNNIKDLRSFLGLASYYRRFVQEFAKIVHPLTQLLKKDVKFSWTNECQIAYEKLIDCLVNAPILTYPNFTKTFYVTCDASKTGIGSVLTQIHDKKHLPIAFYSRALNNAESKYPIYDLEGLSIKVALNKFKFYVLGYPVVIRTDNKPALYLLKSKQCEGRLANYLASIMEFNPQFQHIPGKDNFYADILSRNVNTFSKFNPVLPNAISNVKNIKMSQMNDPALQCYLNNVIKKKYLVVKNDLFYYKDKNSNLKLFVPQNLKLVYLKYFHNVLGCHEGVLRTFERLKRHIFLPNLYDEVKSFVLNCHICKQAKPSHLPSNVLGNFVAPSRPFERVHVDLLGPLPTSQRRFNYILVIVDAFSRYSIFKPIRNKSTKTVINHMKSELLQKLDKPDIVITDQGREFDSQPFKDFCINNDIQLHLCAPYMHQSNGIVERMNLQIENALRCLLLEFKGSWDRYVSVVQNSLNSTVHSSLKYTPLEILNNQMCKLKLPGLFNNNYKMYSQHVDLYEYVKDRNTHVNESFHRKYNSHKRNNMYSVGDHVFVKVPQPSNKLKPRFRGPFEIVDVLPSKFSYLIKNNDDKFMHVHINNIKK